MAKIDEDSAEDNVEECRRRNVASRVRKLIHLSASCLPVVCQLSASRLPAVRATRYSGACPLYLPILHDT